MSQPEERYLEILPEVRYPRIAGLPGWTRLFLSYMLVAVPVWLLLDPLFKYLFHISHSTFLAMLAGDMARAALLSAMMTWVHYRSASACITENFVEGPFLGTKTQRIQRAEVSYVKEVPGRLLAARPPGLLVVQRRPWPGKMVFIPSGVADYQQVKEQLNGWV